MRVNHLIRSTRAETYELNDNLNIAGYKTRTVYMFPCGTDWLFVRPKTRSLLTLLALVSVRPRSIRS